jgi:hypothetical protein
MFHPEAKRKKEVLKFTSPIQLFSFPLFQQYGVLFSIYQKVWRGVAAP